MGTKHITDLLPEYLDGILTEPQSKSVENHLKECDTCSEELKQLKLLYNAFDDEKKVLPSEKIKTEFYKNLEDEKRAYSETLDSGVKILAPKSRWSNNFFKIAASIALLVGSFVLGKYQQEQKSNLEIAALVDESIDIKETAMLSLMENKSASRRIQGVNYIEEFTNPDEAIIKALADRMLHDENTNVRLTAVEALANFTASEIVKKAYITALKTEKDPGIQIMVIQILVQIQEKKAVAPMQRLLQQDNIQPYVKKHIESVLPSII